MISDATNQLDERVGPRGGTTTLTKSGMVRKNFWLPVDEAEALRLKAFNERRTEADIIRQALRGTLGLDD
ncbi:MAG: hypothetical protein AAF604_18690 [Acidobacteriota bacterium]